MPFFKIVVLSRCRSRHNDGYASRRRGRHTPLLQAAQDGNGVDNRGLGHIDLLEAPLQSGVLLNVLPVLVKGCRADAPQLPTAQHWFQQVAGVHSTLHIKKLFQSKSLSL